jgi:hypothetical protein
VVSSRSRFAQPQSPWIPLNTAILMKFAPMGPFMTELYPTNIRGSA